MNNFDEKYWSKIKRLGIFSMIFPVIILVISIVLSNKEFTGLVKNCEEGIARIVQYVLFTGGVAIFFFCDGISDFFVRRFFALGQKKKQENLSSYFTYLFLILWVLNIISITGFIGFLICGNLTWLTLFVILTFSLQMRYFPTHKRFAKLTDSQKK